VYQKEQHLKGIEFINKNQWKCNV